MSKQKKAGRFIALGIVFGTLLGVVTGNLGLWLPLGIAFGGGLEAASNKKEKES